VSDQNIPDQLRYTDEHEWVERVSDTRVRIGITDYAQSKLGDIVFVQLPDVGGETESGEPFGEVESPKSVSDLYRGQHRLGDLAGARQLRSVR